MSRQRRICGAAGFACLALVLAPAQEPGSHEPGAQRIGNGISQPVPIFRPDPDYSAKARKAKVQGTVILSIIVDENGEPTHIRVVKPLGMGLDEKAIEAVEKWRFKPGMKDGRPVKVYANIEVNFRLLDDGWNMGRVEFQQTPGISPGVLQHTHFGKPKPPVAGTVWLALDVDAKGRTQNVRVVRSTNPALESAAADSVRKWRFKPATREGQPAPASATVNLIYSPSRR